MVLISSHNSKDDVQNYIIITAPYRNRVITVRHASIPKSVRINTFTHMDHYQLDGIKQKDLASFTAFHCSLTIMINKKSKFFESINAILLT